MDPLTHALSGALVARASAPAGLPRGSLLRSMAAGFFACAAPDLDIVVRLFGPMEYLFHHRGATHSLILAPLWALPLAWALARMLRAPGGWRELYVVCLLGILLHIGGDLITSYGTMLLVPLSLWRAGIGTTFIIDLWLSGIVVGGLALSLAFRKSRAPALGAFALLACYLGFQYALRERALEFAAQHARAQGLAAARIDVHPRPPTPFNWTVFVSDQQAHRFAHINLMREQVKAYREGDGFLARLDAPYRPLAQAQWETRERAGPPEAQAAWNSPPLEVFRWFAEQPAFDGTTGGCYWFTDLRFLTPGRGDLPFRFGACRDGAGWKLAPAEKPG